MRENLSHKTEVYVILIRGNSGSDLCMAHILQFYIYPICNLIMDWRPKPFIPKQLPKRMVFFLSMKLYPKCKSKKNPKYLKHYRPETLKSDKTLKEIVTDH